MQFIAQNWLLMSKQLWEILIKNNHQMTSSTFGISLSALSEFWPFMLAHAVNCRSLINLYLQNVQPEPSEKPLQPPNEQDFDESKTQTEANVPEKELTEVAGNKGTQGEAEGSQEAGPTRKSGRPIGISKIDLRTVWGSRTPMVDPNDATPMAGTRFCDVLS